MVKYKHTHTLTCWSSFTNEGDQFLFDFSESVQIVHEEHVSLAGFAGDTHQLAVISIGKTDGKHNITYRKHTLWNITRLKNCSTERDSHRCGLLPRRRTFCLDLLGNLEDVVLGTAVRQHHQDFRHAPSGSAHRRQHGVFDMLHGSSCRGQRSHTLMSVTAVSLQQSWECVSVCLCLSLCFLLYMRFSEWRPAGSLYYRGSWAWTRCERHHWTERWPPAKQTHSFIGACSWS